jgi:pimeloyl-ACP methyl ester carboxylesterase
VEAVDNKRVQIIAIHGNGGGAFRFDRTLPFFPEDIEFIPITLPGFAATPKNPDLKTVSAYADHLGAVLTAYDRPIVLGHGIGGSIALDLMQRQPNIVSGLILEAPVGPNLGTRKLPQLMNLPGMKPLVQQLISAKPLRPLLRKKFFGPDIPQPFIDRFFDEYRQCSVFSQMFTIINAEWWDSLKPVRTQTVLWWGSEESLLGADLAKLFTRVVPNSRTIVEQGWDHFPMVDTPQEYSTRLSQIAREVSNSTRANA